MSTLQTDAPSESTPSALRNQRIVAAHRGGPIVLRPLEEPVPIPAPNEVRVRVLATGVAMADVLMREGVYPGTKFPLTPGYDAVGVVEQLGSACDDSTPVGTRVAALTVTGSYARYACIPQIHCVPVPGGVDDAKAVACVLNYTTAYQMLERCVDLDEGDPILVHGAAGGVGTALLQLAKLRDLRVFGTASKGKHESVRELGCEPIDYKRDDFVAVVSAIGGVAAAFDPIGGAHAGRSFRALRPSGTVVCYGSQTVLSGGRLNLVSAVSMMAGSPRWTPLSLLNDSRSAVGYNVTSWRDARPSAYRKDLSAILAMLADGRIDPIVDRRMPLTSAPEAHELLGKSGAIGKIVLIP